MNKFGTLSLLVLSVQSITYNQHRQLVQIGEGSRWEEGQLPWHDQVDFFDKNDAAIAYHTGKFVAAARGAPITNKMEAKAAAEAKAACCTRIVRCRHLMSWSAHSILPLTRTRPV